MQETKLNLDKLGRLAYTPVPLCGGGYILVKSGDREFVVLLRQKGQPLNEPLNADLVEQLSVRVADISQRPAPLDEIPEPCPNPPKFCDPV